MKQLVFASVICFCSLQSAGQLAKDKLALELAEGKYNIDQFDYSRDAIKQFMVDFPRSPYKQKAYFLLAEVYDAKGQTDSAKMAYKEVLKLDDVDSIEANLRHNACVELAFLAYAQKNYELALNYSEKSRKQYGFNHFCGNAFEQNEIGTRVFEGKCYIALQKYNKAIEVLTPYAFKNDLADNGPVVEVLIEAYQKKYTAAQIKNECEKALNSISIKIDKEKEYTTILATTILFGYKTSLPVFIDLDFEVDFGKYDEEKTKARYRELIKESELYKKIEKL